MAIGFAQQYAAPDYTARAAAGVPMDQAAADQSMMPAAPAAAAPSGPYKPSAWDVIQGVLFNGQSPADAAMAARSRNYQTAQMQLMAQALASAPPERRLAMLLNPAKLGEEMAKNFAPVSTAEGATETMFGGPGAGGRSFVAPKTIFDEKSGKVITALPGFSMENGPSAGGDFSAKDGVIVSGRTGGVAGRYSLPQLKPLSSSLEDFTPGVNGEGGQGAGPAGGGGGDKPGAASAGLPRGIRNLNFGNVRPLSNGQQWAGQVGVDPDGYAIFATPQDGVNAAKTNLQSYAKQGINTLSGIVSRWAPKGDGKNDPVAYAHYLAGKLGVDPNHELDLSDPATQQGVLRGIFDFENGPKAMAGWRTPRPQGQGGGASTRTLAEAKAPTILPAGDPAYAALPKGTVLQRSPTGELSVLQKPEYDPASKSTMRDKILTSQEYTQANAAMAAYKAMQANAGTMTGPSAYAILDTFARAINPGAVARPQVIETIEKNLGLPAQLVGGFLSKTGQGNLTPQVRQQVIDAVVPFAQAHWDQANMLNRANAALAEKHQFDPADVTAPLEGRPERLTLTVPPAPQRHPGLYATPKGPLRWTGTGWVAPQ